MEGVLREDRRKSLRVELGYPPDPNDPLAAAWELPRLIALVGNEWAPGSLGKQPAAHFPSPCSAGYPGRSREWLRPRLFGGGRESIPFAGRAKSANRLETALRRMRFASSLSFAGPAGECWIPVPLPPPAPRCHDAEVGVKWT